jgi:hypothetical protein
MMKNGYYSYTTKSLEINGPKLPKILKEEQIILLKIIGIQE